jgi:hypothetical protein
MKTMLPLLLLLAVAPAGQAQFSGVTNTITLPQGAETTPGSGASAYPLAVAGSAHQLYFGTVFGTTEILKVTELRFRLEEGDSSLNAVVPRITFTMSTYVRPLDEFTAFTRDRFGVHGPDARVVYDRSDVRLTATAAPGGLVSPFDLVFPLSEPFYFDPKAGHLLIEFATPLGRPNRNLDAQFTSIWPDGTGVLLGPDAGQSGGLVAQLRYEVVPEPSVTAFASVFFATAALLWRKRR